MLWDHRYYHNNKTIRLIEMSLSSQSAMCRKFLLWKYLGDVDSLGQPPLQWVTKTWAAGNNMNPWTTCGTLNPSVSGEIRSQLCLSKHDLCCPWIIDQRRNPTRREIHQCPKVILSKNPGFLKRFCWAFHAEGHRWKPTTFRMKAPKFKYGLSKTKC